MTAQGFLDHFYKGHFPGMSSERARERVAELEREERLLAATAESLTRKDEIASLKKAVRMRLGGVARSRLELKAAAAGSSLRRSVFDARFKADVGVPPGASRFSEEKEADGFEMYGLVVNVLDRQGDICLPNCVANASEFLADGWIAWSHENLKLPIGYPVSAKQDSHGFRVKAVWHTTDFAQQCRLTVKERQAAKKRVLTSIGYTVNDEAYEKRDGRQVRLLKSINVFECSLVLLPANPAAEVLADGKIANRNIVDDDPYAGGPRDASNWARAGGPDGFAG